ncbi:MAG: ATP phosphoribosyltransferase regulatory subunit [Kiloniellales bacterium]
MTEFGDQTLLPAGFQDVLPPRAAQEAAVIERLIACFASHGYERVKPPLLEFEETILAGAGAAVAQQTFRLMDPVSQRMMGLRADMTPQVARIAATRLRTAPRPLRLCYGGQVLRIKGGQLRPERQFAQVGAELIGAASERADAEVVLLAAEALGAVGIAELSIDLNLPPLVDALAVDLDVDGERLAALRQALDRKDAAAVSTIADASAATFQALLRAAGPAEAALAVLNGMALGGAAATEVARLTRVIESIRAAAPGLTLTVDPAEHRGFEYQTGISFILFARGVRGELGRGGRYATDPSAQLSAGPAVPEPDSATGFTLFMDSVQRALPEPVPPRRLYLPPDCPPARGQDLRAEGWITLAGLDPAGDPAGDPAAEARRLGCSHALIDGAIAPLKD